MRALLPLLPMIAVALAIVPPLAAQEGKSQPPDATKGLKLAETFCTNCHLIGTGEAGRATPGVPSFREIANRPEQTGSRIASVLINPHMPMPNMQLTRQEIGDIVAYLDTLREPSAGAPLLDPKLKGKKPTYPQPS